MAEQAREETDHGAGHAGHLDQQAEEHEERHGKQDQVAHALVHPPGDDERRGVRGDGEVGEGSEREREGDRHAKEHHGADTEEEEDKQVHVLERHQHRAQQRADDDERHHDAEREEGVAGGADAKELDEADDDHQREADRQGGGTPGVDDAERRGDHPGFLLGENKGRADDEDEEGQRCRDRHEVEQRPRPGRHHADEGGHPHVLAAAQRHDRAEHGEPDEEDRGELVRPDERVVQRIAPDDAGEQHDDLDDDEDRRRKLNHAADGVVQPLEPGDWRAPLGLGAELGDGRGFAGNAHATSSFMFWLVWGQPSAELAGDLLQQLPGGIAVLRAP